MIYFGISISNFGKQYILLICVTIFSLIRDSNIVNYLNTFKKNASIKV